LHCGAVVLIEDKASPMAAAGMALQNWDNGVPHQVDIGGGLLLGRWHDLGQGSFLLQAGTPREVQV